MSQAYTPTLNPSKFEQLLLHIAERSVSDPAFGKTKLNKILYYIDFNAFGLLGAPITGATYQHRPFGPVPVEITTVRANLARTGRARVDSALSFGYPQDRLVANAPADLTEFSPDELHIIDAVIDWLLPYNATAVSELSHREFGYRMSSDGETIPYESVFISSRVPTPDDHVRADEVWRFLYADGPHPGAVRVPEPVSA